MKRPAEDEALVAEYRSYEPATKAVEMVDMVEMVVVVYTIRTLNYGEWWLEPRATSHTLRYFTLQICDFS